MKIALVIVALNEEEPTDKTIQKNEEKCVQNTRLKTKKEYEHKRKNTEKSMTNLKKNVKYANALSKNIIVQNTRKQKCI